MFRAIVLLVIGFLVVVGGIAVALYHFFGWQGLIAFPLVLVVLLWLGKLVVGSLLKRFFLGLFGVKSGVLRGAVMTVHTITPALRPLELIEISDDAAEVDVPGPFDEPGEEAGLDPEEQHDYFDVDVTIAPKGEGERIWEPGELILTTQPVTSLDQLGEGNDVGHIHKVMVWNGSLFGPDGEGKYPGEQRLMLTFKVNPGVRKVWVQYYDVPLGELRLPEPLRED
jgi:hypothetical protein